MKNKFILNNNIFYNNIYSLLLTSAGYEGLPFQIGSAMIAGFFGAILSTPADVRILY